MVYIIQNSKEGICADTIEAIVMLQGLSCQIKNDVFSLLEMQKNFKNCFIKFFNYDFLWAKQNYVQPHHRDTVLHASPHENC